MPRSLPRLLEMIAFLAGLVPVLAGCGGAVNVQTQGGGAEGFAYLGAIALGTSALRYIRGTGRTPHAPATEAPLPPPYPLSEADSDTGKHDRGEATESGKAIRE